MDVLIGMQNLKFEMFFWFTGTQISLTQILSF